MEYDVPALVRRPLAALFFRFAFAGAAAWTLFACGPTKQQYGTGILQYSENAKRAYEDAMIAFKDRDWQEATLLLRDVRRRFSFSAYAPLAQLRMADIEYEQEKWIESISAYKGFLRENPKHRDAAWASMRIARCFYNQVSDAFLLPPQETRDQSAVIEAATKINDYVEQYKPGTEYPDGGPEWEEMKALGADARARLVAHELYIARFYIKKDKLEAALGRVTYAVVNFHGSKRDAEALILQGEIFLMLKRRPEARASFEVVLSKYAADPRIVQAKKFLAQMDLEESKK